MVSRNGGTPPSTGPAAILRLTGGGADISIIGWMLFGLIVGVVAKLLMPGRDPGGMIVTILLGIGGALVGGFLGRVLAWMVRRRRSGRLYYGRDRGHGVTVCLS